jgi:putative DNA primase/helicase
MHPSGNTYRWLPNTGNPGKIPVLSQAHADSLLSAARSLCQAPYTRQETEAQQKRLADALAAKPLRRGKAQASVIEAYNQAHPIREILEAHGYTPRGAMYCRPGVTDRSSVVLHDNKSFHFSTNDLMYGPHLVDPFDVFASYEHGGDPKAAAKAAAEELGISRQSKKTEEYPYPENLTPLDSYDEEEQTPDYPPDKPPDNPPTDASATPKQSVRDTLFNNAPFRLLGYNQGRYHYMSRETNQITILTAREHQKIPLLSIAPIQFWESCFLGDNGPNWTAWANALFRESARRGVFDARQLRGLGVWGDDGRIVIHRGDHLIVDGERLPISGFDTRYIYQATHPQGGIDKPPLSKTEANRIIDITNRLPFESEMQGRLLAGWCVLAPICGILDWRPHIWLTGAHGTGKTWIQNNIISPLLGQAAFKVKSESTAAGIRQYLGNDARPVLFEEAEGEDIHNQERMFMVLSLMRQASSRGDGNIVKGTPAGGALMYDIQSCFLFGSIGTNIVQKSDASRIAVLNLIKQPAPSEDQDDPFKTLCAMTLETITDDFCERFQSRTIRLIPVIQANIKTFTDAATAHFGDRRKGDQYGALMAGAYSLFSDSEIQFSQALEWIKKQQWDSIIESEIESDEMRCLYKILHSFIQIRESGNIKDRTIGKLLEIASKKLKIATPEIGEPGIDDVERTLKRYGIKIVFRDDGVGDLLIADNHEAIKNIMRDSPWKNNYNQQLRRLPDAKKENPQRFDAGPKLRCTRIPLKNIFGGDEE